MEAIEALAIGCRELVRVTLYQHILAKIFFFSFSQEVLLQNPEPVPSQHPQR
jgi:hypothetical protein